MASRIKKKVKINLYAVNEKTAIPLNESTPIIDDLLYSSGKLCS